MQPILTASNPAPYGSLASGEFGTFSNFGANQEAYPPMSSPQLAYIPNDLRPITAAFPQQMLMQSSKQSASYAQNSSLLPLSMDALNLPLQQELKEHGQMPPFAASPTAWMGASTPSIPYTPPVLPVLPLAVQPPSIKDDPMLEEVMRQAQMGLFILSGREKSVTNISTKR